MLQLLKQFLIIIAILYNSSLLKGQEIINLNDVQKSYSTIDVLEYYTDSSRTITIDDILSNKIRFQKKEKSRVNFAMSNNIHWYRFSIKDNSAKENKWIIEFKHALVEDIQLFLVNSTGSVINEQKAGLKYNQSEVELVFRNPIFPIITDNEKYDVFLRIDTRSAVYTTINIYESCAFWGAEKTERSLMFLLSGILLAISILNLILFLITKEWSYLLLAAFLSFSILLFFSLYGYLFEFFPDLSLIQKVKSRIITYQISIILLSFFSIKFLDIKRVSNIGYKILSGVIIFYLAFLVSSIINILPTIFEYKLVVFSYPTFVLILIFVIILAIKKHHESAIYYLIAFGIFLFVSIIFLLVTKGVITGNLFTNNISSIGTTFFSLLLTIALNEKISKLRKVQSEAIKLAEDKDELAKEIKIRVNTEKALKKSENDLKEVNKSKDRFFSILAHDLINPFNTILGFGSLLKENIKMYDLNKIEEYIDIINKTSTRTFKLLENLLEWSRSQTNTIEYKPVKLNISETITDLILLFDSQKTKKNIEIITDLEQNIYVFADLNMIKTVIRNLLSNAIKFTENGLITITSKTENSLYKFSITDNGIGISEKDISNLFSIDISTSSPGTDGEKGTGIGLILCKEFIDKNKGEISVESKKGIGSTFTFSLPLNEHIDG